MLRFSIIVLLALSFAACDTTLPEEPTPVVKELVGIQIPIADTIAIADPGGIILYDQRRSGQLDID